MNEILKLIEKKMLRIGKSIKHNYLFWISIIFACYLLKTEESPFGMSLLSFILAMFNGYLIHIGSHLLSLKKIYKKIIKKSIRKKYPKLDKIIRIVILYTFDFHDKIHHNTKISRKPFNVLTEAFQNLITQSLILIVPFKSINFKFMVFNKPYEFNYIIILLYGLLYVTFHHINFYILTSREHEYHHNYPKTNINGEQVFDIFFDTHVDCNNESFNHASINIILLCVILFYYKKYLP